MMYRAGIGFIGSMGAVSLGRVESAAEHALNDPLATRGRAMASQFPFLGSARASGPSDEWRRGFDIGAATSAGNTQYGPGQAAVFARLHTVALQSGFIKARDTNYAVALADPKTGAALAAAAGKPSSAGLQKGGTSDTPSEGTSALLIAGGAAAVVAAGAAIYFFVLKK